MYYLKFIFNIKILVKHQKFDKCYWGYLVFTEQYLTYNFRKFSFKSLYREPDWEE